MCKKQTSKQSETCEIFIVTKAFGGKNYCWQNNLFFIYCVGTDGITDHVSWTVLVEYTVPKNFQIVFLNCLDIPFYLGEISFRISAVWVKHIHKCIVQINEILQPEAMKIRPFPITRWIHSFMCLKYLKSPRLPVNLLRRYMLTWQFLL